MRRCAPGAQNAPSPTGTKIQVKQMLDRQLRKDSFVRIINCFTIVTLIALSVISCNNSSKSNIQKLEKLSYYSFESNSTNDKSNNTIISNVPEYFNIKTVDFNEYHPNKDSWYKLQLLDTTKEMFCRGDFYYFDKTEQALLYQNGKYTSLNVLKNYLINETTKFESIYEEQNNVSRAYDGFLYYLIDRDLYLIPKHNVITGIIPNDNASMNFGLLHLYIQLSAPIYVDRTVGSIYTFPCLLNENGPQIIDIISLRPYLKDYYLSTNYNYNTDPDDIVLCNRIDLLSNDILLIYYTELSNSLIFSPKGVTGGMKLLALHINNEAKSLQFLGDFDLGYGADDGVLVTTDRSIIEYNLTNQTYKFYVNHINTEFDDDGNEKQNTLYKTFEYTKSSSGSYYITKVITY